MRLVDGFSPSEGRVETCWNNTWIVACDSSWDDMDASVVCRQLGFGKMKAVMSHIGQVGHPACLGARLSFFRKLLQWACPQRLVWTYVLDRLTIAIFFYQSDPNCGTT